MTDSMDERAGRIRGRSAHGGVLLVPCCLNRVHRYWFLADTGAAQTVIRPQVAGEIGVDVTRPLRYQQIFSIHRMERASVVRLEQMQVGYHSLVGVEALVLDLPPSLRIDGLLGVNFLSRFRATFEFDIATLVLRTRPSRY